MAEPIQEVFWLISADRQQLLYVSPAFETIWGRPVESLYTYPGAHLKLMMDSIHPSDKERVVAAFAQQLQHEYQQEYRIVRPDGSMRWVRSRSFPVQNPQGETWGIAGFIEDITKRKHSDKILHQREQEFTALVEHSPDIIARFDQQLRHVYVNPAIEPATGIRREEFLGKTNRDLGMPPELLSVWEPSIQTVFQTGKPDENEFSYLTPQGWRYYQSRLFPELGGDGSVESVLAICRDLTKNKQMEEALRESEERFRTVFEFAPLGIVICNGEGRLLQSNQAFQNILGYGERELENLTFIELTHPDERADSLKQFQELLVGKCSHFNLEKRYLRKDGCLVWVNLSVSAIYDANGLFEYAIAMLQDISNAYGELRLRKQAESELREAHEELERRVTERTAELAEANRLLKQEIAQRKLAQSELKAQKEFLQTVIDTTPNMIYVKDREGNFVLANQAHADFYGITVEEVLGHTTAQLNSYPADVERFIAQDQDVLTTLQTKVIPEEACHTSTGEVRWFQTIKKPLFPNDGQVRHVFGVSTDITDLKVVKTQLQQAKEQLLAVLDSVPGFVSWISSEGRYLGVNQHLAESFNMSPDEFIGKELGFLKNSSEFVQFMIQFLASSAQTDRKVIEIQVSGSPRNYLIVTQKYNQESLAVSVGIDITECKQAEEALQIQKEFLQTVLDTNPNFIWVRDREDKIVLANQATANFLETTVADLIGKTSPELHANLAYTKEFPAQDQEVLNTLQEKFIPEEAFPTPSGELRWFQTIKKPIFSSDGQVCQVLGVSTDITQHKLVEERLRLSEARFRLALDNLPNTFVIYNSQRQLQFVNAHGLRISGKTLEEHFGKTDEEIWPHEVTKEYVPILKHAVETRTLQSRECTITLPHTQPFTFVVTYVPLLNERGEIHQILGITHDITQRKQAEAQIQASLREKEVLLQEIHHRVKNNLQVISSLLDLQSQYIDQPAMLEVFQESQNRVKSMALIHEQLYQSKDCAKINLSNYIKDLTNYLLRVYEMKVDHIKLELDIEEVTLNINKAIPCGLIISELVSNAMKYAFPQRQEGMIKIALNSKLDNYLELIVKDNGVGLPFHSDFSNIQSLGLQLVTILTRQIEGSLEVNSRSGTEFKIHFSPFID